MEHAAQAAGMRLIVSRKGIARRLKVAAVALACLSVPTAAQHTSYNLPPESSGPVTAQLEAQRRILFARMQANPRDLDAAFRYANISSKLGDLEGAIATYEQMLIIAPNTPRIQLELGALHYRLGAIGSAKGYFDTVYHRSDLPPPVRSKIETYHRLIEVRRKATTGFSARLSFGARYQSNANSAPTGTTVSLVGTDWVLDPNSRGDDDLSATIAGQLSYKLPLNQDGDSLNFSVTGSMSEYADRTELASRTLEARVGPDFSVNRFGLRRGRMTVQAFAGKSWVDGTEYIDTKGVFMGLRAPIGQKMQWGVTFDWRDEDYATSASRRTAYMYSGTRTTVNAMLTRQVTPDWQLMGGAFHERRSARADFHSYRETGLQVGASHRHKPLIGDGQRSWTLSLTGKLGRRNYDAPQPIVSRTTKQHNTEYLFQAAENVPLNDDVSLTVYGGIRGSDSNYDIRTYNDKFLGINLTRSF